MDFNGGLNLGYVWNNDPDSYNWSPTVDDGLPSLPAHPIGLMSPWSFGRTRPGFTFAPRITPPVSLAPRTSWPTSQQPFDAATLFGSDAASRLTVSPATLTKWQCSTARSRREICTPSMVRRSAACSPGCSRTCRDRLIPLRQATRSSCRWMLGGTPPLTFIWRANGTPFATSSSNTLVIGTSTLANTGSYDVASRMLMAI